MRAILYDRLADGATGFRLGEVSDPRPGAGEIRLKVAAFGLNRADLPAPMHGAELPRRIGYEASGVIDAVGTGVTQWQLGDRVSVVPTQFTAHPCAAEYAVTAETMVTSWPDGWPGVEAASFVMSYLTAYYPMVELTPLHEGSSALVTVASGGTGPGAMQLARCCGATVLATTRHRSKRQFLLDQGADQVIVTGDEDLSAAIREATGGRGVDLVLDGVAGPFIERYVGGLARNGAIYVHGGLSGSVMASFPVVPLMRNRASLSGYMLANELELSGPEVLQRGLDWVQAAIASGRLPRPAIDSVWSLDDAVQAYDRQASGDQRGKVVVCVDDTIRS